MKDSVGLLVKLQAIDSRILEKSIFIEKVPARIHEVDEPLKRAKLEFDKIKQNNEGLLRKKKEKEKLLEEVNEKINKMKSRVAEIKTNKEYQAHLKEIEASQQEISKIEEDILLIMEDLDVSMKLEKEKDDRVKIEVGKINAFKKKLDEEVDIYQKELAVLKEERAELGRQIEPDVYKLYMTLIDGSGGVAVAAAKNEMCTGCNMNIPPQLFVEIRKSEEIFQCPQCRRILYFSEDAPQNA